MKNTGFKIFALILIILIMYVFAFLFHPAFSEDIDEVNYITVTVTGSNLNCRMAPNKHSYIVTELEKGQEIQLTGRWSKDRRWVEIEHCEYGRLWCDYHYLTERTDSFIVETLCDDPVKIRKQVFNGKVKGYLRKNKTLEITQVVLGWGKCSQGWIDLEYCIEIMD